MPRYAIYRRARAGLAWHFVASMSDLGSATEAAAAITATGYGQTVVLPECITPAGRIAAER